MADIFKSATELGIIYAIMALGVFISFRTLNMPDLTVDSSFTLGAALRYTMREWVSGDRANCCIYSGLRCRMHNGPAYNKAKNPAHFIRHIDDAGTLLNKPEGDGG